MHMNIRNILIFSSLQSTEMRKKINIFQISGVHFARSGVSRLTNNKLAAQGDDDDDGGCISMDQEKHFVCFFFSPESKLQTKFAFLFLFKQNFLKFVFLFVEKHLRSHTVGKVLCCSDFWVSFDLLYKSPNLLKVFLVS